MNDVTADRPEGDMPATSGIGTSRCLGGNPQSLSPCSPSASQPELVANQNELTKFRLNQPGVESSRLSTSFIHEPIPSTPCMRFHLRNAMALHDSMHGIA